ncbi:MAG: ATP-binding cassette domain-containing protein [Oscillospiraceae bacterium]
MDEIRISHVSKSYTTLSTDLVIGNAKRPSRTRKVLEDVNLAFPAGQLSVLVGRSGCGKSTLLKMLAGKESPDSGEISLPHGWHAALQPRALRHHVDQCAAECGDGLRRGKNARGAL